MKGMTSISLFASGLAGLAAVAIFGLSVVKAHGNDPNTLTVDIACDCRTGSKGFFSGTREDGLFIISGKIFPAGTLPSGNATNDPTQPGSIGDWTCRGQQAFPFPSEVASAYDATPPVFNTQYFILNDGRGLTLEGWVKTGFTGELLSITGGIGSLSGAAGFTEEAPVGTNATMCPNFRATLHFRPGSFQRGASQ